MPTARGRSRLKISFRYLRPLSFASRISSNFSDYVCLGAAKGQSYSISSPLGGQVFLNHQPTSADPCPFNPEKVNFSRKKAFLLSFFPSARRKFLSWTFLPLTLPRENVSAQISFKIWRTFRHRRSRVPPLAHRPCGLSWIGRQWHFVS